MALNFKGVGLWVTPTSREELQQMVSAMDSPEAIHAMMFTWNYMVKVINEASPDEMDYECNDCGSDNITGSGPPSPDTAS